MKLYRLSPITSEAELRRAIEFLHAACHQLCFETFGRYLPVSGNVGIFAHYTDEYVRLQQLQDRLVNRSVHYNHKYFLLHQPVSIPPRAGLPGATYHFLYIRQPDPYRSQVGDIDFVLPDPAHAELSAQLDTQVFQKGARRFGRLDENMIELINPDVDAASYVVTQAMTERLLPS